MAHLRNAVLVLAALMPFACLADLGEDLLAAVRKGDAERVKAVLAQGADVNAKSPYGATGLFFAADRGNIEIIRILLDHGANVNVKDTFYGATALTWATQKERWDVIKLLLKAGSPDQAAQMVADMLAQGKKIPGFGHRVYRTEDPRATHLRVASEELGKRTGHTTLFLASQRVEQVVKQEKKLNANVDFYSASTYYSLGIPVDLFTPVFAVSRMSGWTAHVLEQYHNNRLIRPRAEYKGNADGMPWIPIERR